MVLAQNPSRRSWHNQGAVQRRSNSFSQGWLMGKFDSSKTRVVPVFDHLLRSDSSGRSWLPLLVRLGSRVADVALPVQLGVLVPGHQSWWGSNERPLAPPLSLLEWLVQNVSEEQVAKSGGHPETVRKRRALASGDPKVVQEALRRLRASERGRQWFVLEGDSFPDACLETDSVVLVVEGKRTERSTTSKTTWMRKRSQLIRHMDATWEIAAGRAVLGLLLVEGEDPDPMLVPEHWSAASDEQLQPDLLIPSLPHRTDEERDAIAGGVLGAATWQAVCHEFSIDWPPVPDAI